MHRRLPDELGKRPRWMGEVEWGFSLTLGYIHMMKNLTAFPPRGGRWQGGTLAPKLYSLVYITKPK